MVTDFNIGSNLHTNSIMPRSPVAPLNVYSNRGPGLKEQKQIEHALNYSVALRCHANTRVSFKQLSTII